MEKFRICHFNAIVSCEVVPGKTPISTDIVYLLPRRRDEESREESLLHYLLPPHPGSHLTNSSSETFPEIIWRPFAVVSKQEIYSSKKNYVYICFKTYISHAPLILELERRIFEIGFQRRTLLKSPLSDFCSNALIWVQRISILALSSLHFPLILGQQVFLKLAQFRKTCLQASKMLFELKEVENIVSGSVAPCKFWTEKKFIANWRFNFGALALCIWHSAWYIVWCINRWCFFAQQAFDLTKIMHFGRGSILVLNERRSWFYQLNF